MHDEVRFYEPSAVELLSCKLSCKDLKTTPQSHHLHQHCTVGLNQLGLWLRQQPGQHIKVFLSGAKYLNPLMLAQLQTFPLVVL